MQKESVKKNLIYNMTYQIFVMILPFITAPYLSRVIGAKGVGTYSYLFSVAMYFVYFAMLGILNYGNRQISRVGDDFHKRSAVFSSIYSFQLIVSVTVFVIYLLYVCFITQEDQDLSLIMGLYVLSAVFDISWLYFGLQEFKITSIRQILIRLVSFIAILAFVREKSDLTKYVFIMSLSYMVSAVSLWPMLKKRIKWVKPVWSEIFVHMKPCVILFVPIIATSLYRVMDKIMLGQICGYTDVGYYENAEKLISISLGLISSFGAVMMPKISNLHGKGKELEAKKLFNTSMEMAMCLGIAIFFGIASVSKEFIPIFFGEEFAPAIKLSIALSITVPFITWAAIVRMLYLIPYECDGIYVKSVILGAVMNVIFNSICIPKFGTMGAVFGTWAAEISVALYQTILVRKDLELKKYLRQSLIFLLMGIIMTICVRLTAGVMKNSIVGLVVEIIVGGIVYVGLTFVYLLKTKNEIFMKKKAKLLS